jgi:hypothetical protein
MGTSAVMSDGNGDIWQKTMERNEGSETGCFSPLDSRITRKRRLNNRVQLGNGEQPCGYLRNRIGWRKDLRSIPKVFLIDAYEVS